MGDFFAGEGRRTKTGRILTFMEDPNDIAIGVKLLYFTASQNQSHSGIGKLMNQAIEIRFRSDIQSPAGFIQKKNGGFFQHPLGKDYLLLVAARKLPDGLNQR